MKAVSAIFALIFVLVAVLSAAPTATVQAIGPGDPGWCEYLLQVITCQCLVYGAGQSVIVIYPVDTAPYIAQYEQDCGPLPEPTQEATEPEPDPPCIWPDEFPNQVTTARAAPLFYAPDPETETNVLLPPDQSARSGREVRGFIEIWWAGARLWLREGDLQ